MGVMVMVSDAATGILHLCVQLPRYGYLKMRMHSMIQLNCACKHMCRIHGAAQASCVYYTLYVQ